MQRKAVVNPEKKHIRKERNGWKIVESQFFCRKSYMTYMSLSRCLSPLPILSFALYLPVTLSMDVNT